VGVMTRCQSHEYLTVSTHILMSAFRDRRIHPNARVKAQPPPAGWKETISIFVADQEVRPPSPYYYPLIPSFIPLTSYTGRKDKGML
jgi:hypothetical protein